VRDRERGEEGKLTCYLAAHVAVFLVDGFVLGLVFRAHVPVEAVLESGRVVVVIVDLLELDLFACQGSVRLDEVGFGFRDKPVGECGRDVGVFLSRILELGQLVGNWHKNIRR
jgi:hypothetical protein